MAGELKVIRTAETRKGGGKPPPPRPRDVFLAGVAFVAIGAVFGAVVLVIYLTGQDVGGLATAATFALTLIVGIACASFLMIFIARRITRGEAIPIMAIAALLGWDPLIGVALSLGISDTLSGFIAGSSLHQTLSGLYIAEYLGLIIFSGYMVGSGVAKMAFARWWNRISSKVTRSPSPSLNRG